MFCCKSGNYYTEYDFKLPFSTIMVRFGPIKPSKSVHSNNQAEFPFEKLLDGTTEYRNQTNNFADEKLPKEFTNLKQGRACSSTRLSVLYR